MKTLTDAELDELRGWADRRNAGLTGLDVMSRVIALVDEVRALRAANAALAAELLAVKPPGDRP